VTGKTEVILEYGACGGAFDVPAAAASVKKHPAVGKKLNLTIASAY
jgi:hypothetical protein